MFNKWRKRRHFKQSHFNVTRKLWDLEFLRSKHRSMREGIRVEYDRLKERVDAAQLRLEAENKKDKQDKKVIENLDNLVKRHGDDLTQMEKQMKSIDETIQAKEGIDEKMEGLRTVLELIKEHIKKL